MNYREQLAHVQFGANFGPEPLERVEQLENIIGVRLPSDYRTFLLEVGGGYVRDALAACTEPTPFGEHIMTVIHRVEEVIGLLDSLVAPRNMICIGFGHFARTTCMSVAGLDHGQVFSLDTRSRYYWNNDTIAKFPALDPSIREFFRLRDADELPEHPWGYENCYHIAKSFTEFLGKLYREE